MVTYALVLASDCDYGWVRADLFCYANCGGMVSFWNGYQDSGLEGALLIGVDMRDPGVRIATGACL